MEKVRILATLLDALGVCYTMKNETEIVIDCPANVIPPKMFFEKDYLEMKDFLYNPESGCYTDEAKIFVTVDEYGYLSWLVGLPDYSKEED